MTGDPERWIVIPRWDEFQHRDMARSSVPPWIKNMTQLLGDTDYLRLSLSQRGILHGLWMLYASQRRVVSESDASRVLVRSASDARRWRVHLESLNHAGWITFSASRPARNTASEHASLEVEVEKKVVREQRSARKNGAAAAFAIRTMIANGAISTNVDLEGYLTDEKLTDTQRDELRGAFTT